MMAHALHRSSWSLIALTAAAALAGCDDNRSSLAPTEQPVMAASRGDDVDLGQCTDLSVPAGSRLVLHAYAEGVQIYQREPTVWTFKAPSATLYSNAARTKKIGTHYSGPTWESNNGGFVVGQLNTPCSVGPDDIPWLLLDGVQSEGPGVFKDVKYIQRVNTVGGLAPVGPGAPGELKEVPYTAEYYFYRAP